uniref:L-type lectin-like domain-containing protein n=2 Tax=Parascaris univalens TaxID=6257 RepID=A0A915C5D7_PARUN
MRRALCGVAFFLFSVIISFALPRQNTNGNFVDSEAALINASSIYTLRGAFSKDHSLVKPYDGSTWVIGGMALASTHLVRLTPDIPSRYGSMWNTVPVSFRSWEVEIKFKIYGSDTERSGEGMAFWYVDQSTRSGPAFGFPDVFRGLGVFIDTSEDDVTDINHYHPFISALVNNGTIRYAHDAFGTFSQLGGVDGGCYAPLLSEEEPSKMLVRYAARTLSIFVAAVGSSHWLFCMKSEGVILPAGFHFAISASTGPETSGTHELISVKTFALESSDDDSVDVEVISAAKVAPPRIFNMISRPFNVVRTALLILLPIMFIAIVLTCAFVSFVDKMSVRSKRLF